MEEPKKRKLPLDLFLPTTALCKKVGAARLEEIGACLESVRVCRRNLNAAVTGKHLDRAEQHLYACGKHAGQQRISMCWVTLKVARSETYMDKEASSGDAQKESKEVKELRAAIEKAIEVFRKALTTEDPTDTGPESGGSCCCPCTTGES